MSKVFLVAVTMTIPVVAEDEDDAVLAVQENHHDMIGAAVDQMMDDLSEGDTSDVEFHATELTEAGLDADSSWRDVVPFGTELENTIEDHVMGLVEEDEEGEDTPEVRPRLWDGPNHEDD